MCIHRGEPPPGTSWPVKCPLVGVQSFKSEFPSSNVVPCLTSAASFSFFVSISYVTMAPAKTQNTALARGINMISSNALAAKNGRFNFYGKGPQKKAAPAPVAETKTSKWYPADNIPTPVASAKTARNCKKTAKLRASIVPGTILILLSGRFRGKRVVFLKQLKSGALLITGRSSCVLKVRSGSMMKTYTWRGRAESRWFLL